MLWRMGGKRARQPVSPDDELTYSQVCSTGTWVTQHSLAWSGAQGGVAVTNQFEACDNIKAAV